MTKLTIQQKKDFAKMLFLNNINISQKEVAQRAGVSEKTISNWIKKGNWDNLRRSLLTTRESQLSNLYMQLQALNETIANREKDNGGKYATPKEVDTLIKLTAAVKNLEQDLSIADIVNVSKKFLDYVRKTDLEKSKELSAIFDAFIKDSIK